MRYPARAGSRERTTLCISSQAGCAVGCPFCATGELGFGRDLTTAEIVDQVRWAARRLAGEGRRLTNVVFMGMGEPLLNLDRVLASVEALSDPARFGLGARHITVSYLGGRAGIRRLTALGPQFTLAVSSTRRATRCATCSCRSTAAGRSRRSLAAARDHARATGRRVSYEYTMIGGMNDTDLDATALATLLRGDLAHVNLIPMNPVAHTPWSREPDARHRGVRGSHPGGRDPGHDPAQPGPGDRRRLRSARGRVRRASRPPRSWPVVASASKPQSAAALRGERSAEPVPAHTGGPGEEPV